MVALLPSALLDISSEASEFAVNAGAETANVDIRVEHGAVITGTVTKADGRPLVAGHVLVQRVCAPDCSKDPLPTN